MKRRLLSILLTLGMILSLLPVTALAATGYDDNWYHYRQKWMYKVTASKEATANEKTINIGENIRETTDTAGHGTIPTIEFGAVTYGNADKNPLTLTFTNTTEDEDIVGAGDTNPNNWGKVYVTIGSKSKYFDFKWDSKNGQINKGESSTVTITPRNDIPAGPQEETVVFMEQNSRVGWSVKLQVTMEPTPVTVTPATAVNKYYGQTLKPSDIGIAEITGDGVSKEDFKTLAALGLSEVPGEKDHVKENVGTYNLTYGEPQTIGKYKITFNGNTEVTVKQATPVPKWVNASGVVYNGELRSSQITGDYVNPYTGEKVNGDFTWLGGTAGQQLIASGEHDYTFTPTDGNHTTATGKVFVAVGGDVTGGSSGSSGRPITTVLTVDAHIEEEYNAQPKTVKVDVTSGYPTEKLEFKYRKQGTEPWMEGKPIDAGTYDIMITAPVTANYTGASTTTSLTIKPKKLDVVFQVYNKFFDNDVDAQLSIVGDPYIYDRDKDKFTLTGKEIQKYVTKVEFEDAQAGVDKTVNIVVDEVTLEGEGASNYCLPAGTYTAKATISPRSVQLNVGAQAVKYYGQTMTFVPSDFTATPANEKDGLIAGDVIDSLEATFSSEGTNPIAPVDSYSVTAASSSKNYKIEKVEGTMKVAPAMPEGTVAALKGAANAELSTIAASLTGTFMNPYNGEPVPGKVTWKDDTQSISGTINETKSFEYIFTPEDKTNYVTVTGKVDVTAANGVPAPIVVEGNTSLVYTGDPQPIKIKEVDKVEFTVKYSSKDQEDWGDEAPRDVGSYQAKITATAGNGSGYVNNDSTVEIVITPATPTAVKPSGVKAGDTLSDIKPVIQGVKGETVSGTFAWDNVGEKTPAEVKVAAGTSYGWTFTPGEGVTNYTVASGSMELVAAPVNNGGGGAGGGGIEEPPVEQPPEEQPGEALTPEAVADSTGGVKAQVAAEDMTAGVQSAKDSKHDSVVIAPQVEGSADKVAVEVPKSSVSDVAGAGLALKVETGLGSVTLPAGSLSKLAEQAGDKVSVSVASGEDSQVSIDVKVGSTSVDRLDNGLSVSLPAKEGNVLVIVDADGNETVVKKSLVDGGSVAALLDGSCTVKVVDNSKDFRDVPANAWYESAVDFASSHQLFEGVSATSFGPGSNMTRGMLATVLWRLEDEAKAGSAASFSDVGDTWYTEGVAWASEQGIITGYGGNRFGPDNDITRQELAVMLYRYAKQAGLAVDASGSLGSFRDGGAVSGYASDAMKWAVGVGLVRGDGGMLNPGGNATRAQVATMLQRMVGLLVE